MAGYDDSVTVRSRVVVRSIDVILSHVRDALKEVDEDQLSSKVTKNRGHRLQLGRFGLLCAALNEVGVSPAQRPENPPQGHL